MNGQVIIDAGAYTCELTVNGQTVGPVDIVELHKDLGTAMWHARHKDAPGGKTRIVLYALTLRRA